MSTAIAKTQTGGVPALYTPPKLEIDSSDVEIPSVRFGHHQSDMCQEHNIKLGVIYSATSKDDPDPQTIWDPATRGDNPGMLFHVLSMYKGKSKKVGEELMRWSFNDPDAPADADVTYNYSFMLPDLDTEIPFRVTLSRTKTPAARTINTVLLKNEGRAPAYAIAFRMTTVNKKKEGVGSWTVPQVRMVEAQPEHVAAAEQLAMLIARRPDADVSSTASDAPGI